MDQDEDVGGAAIGGQRAQWSEYRLAVLGTMRDLARKMDDLTTRFDTRENDRHKELSDLKIEFAVFKTKVVFITAAVSVACSALATAFAGFVVNHFAK